MIKHRFVRRRVLSLFGAFAATVSLWAGGSALTPLAAHADYSACKQDPHYSTYYHCYSEAFSQNNVSAIGLGTYMQEPSVTPGNAVTFNNTVWGQLCTQNGSTCNANSTYLEMGVCKNGSNGPQTGYCSTHSRYVAIDGTTVWAASVGNDYTEHTFTFESSLDPSTPCSMGGNFANPPCWLFFVDGHDAAHLVYETDAHYINTLGLSCGTSCPIGDGHTGGAFVGAYTVGGEWGVLTSTNGLDSTQSASTFDNYPAFKYTDYKWYDWSNLNPTYHVDYGCGTTGKCLNGANSYGGGVGHEWSENKP